MRPSSKERGVSINCKGAGTSSEEGIRWSCRWVASSAGRCQGAGTSHEGIAEVARHLPHGVRGCRWVSTGASRNTQASLHINLYFLFFTSPFYVPWACESSVVYAVAVPAATTAPPTTHFLNELLAVVVADSAAELEKRGGKERGESMEKGRVSTHGVGYTRAFLDNALPVGIVGGGDA